MDKYTQLAAIAALAKSAAEIAADIATDTSEAAGQATEYTMKSSNPRGVQNTVVGGLLPCEPKLAALQDILRAIHALHKTDSV